MPEERIGTSASSENWECHADQESCIFKDSGPSDASELIRCRAGTRTDRICPDQRPLVILDVRTPREYWSGRIDGSIMLDFRSPSFPEEVMKLDREKAYLVYCRTGRRSSLAIGLMRKLGFKELYSLAGGLVGWQREGFDAVKG